MHIFMDNFNQGGKYSDQRASHQAKLRIKENFTDQKSLSVSSLQTDYLNFYSSSGCGKNSERANIVKTRCKNICEVPTIPQKNVSKGPERKRKNIVRLLSKSLSAHIYG